MTHRHNCLVVYRRLWRDWWRKTYWVVCCYCDETLGPYFSRASAQEQADAQNGLPFKD